MQSEVGSLPGVPENLRAVAFRQPLVGEYFLTDAIYRQRENSRLGTPKALIVEPAPGFEINANEISLDGYPLSLGVVPQFAVPKRIQVTYEVTSERAEQILRARLRCEITGVRPLPE